VGILLWVSELIFQYEQAKEHFITEVTLGGERVVASKNGANAVILFYTFEEAHKYLGSSIQSRDVSSIDMDLNSHLKSLNKADLEFQLKAGAGYFEYVNSFWRNQ